MRPKTYMPRASLESVNSVTIASCAIQQLPKLLHAMSNMARRSRRQLHRKGILLGGQWMENGRLHSAKSLPFTTDEDSELTRRKGILKNAREPGLDRLSAYNEFWKTFSFSFVPPNRICDVHDSFHEFPSVYCPHRQLRLTAPQNKEEILKSNHASFSSHLCQKNLQGGIYRAQTVVFLESFPVQLSNLDKLKEILFNYLNQSQISFEEEEILLQLQYLKILFNTPIHKLVRERPKEYLIPLPRRHSRRSAGRQSYPPILATHQTIMLPPIEKDKSPSWFSLSNLSLSQSRWLSSRKMCGQDENALVCALKTKTVPRGVSFITYPDSVDETSFEGTIGGRTIISWVEGTKFPQMGIDQSSEFKFKKEMGKQHMIQSRMRAARVYRRICCENWNSYTSSGGQCPNKDCPRRKELVNSKKKSTRKNKTTQKKHSERTGHSLFRCWFKLAQLKESLKVINESVQTVGSTTFGPRNVGIPVRISKKEAKAVKRAERKRRLKVCMVAIAKFLTCGLLRYILKGECRVRKKRTLRTTDSTERCRTPELPPESALSTPTQPELPVCEKTFEKIST